MAEAPGLVVERVPQSPSPEEQPQETPDDRESVRQALAEVAHGLERQLERRLPSIVVAALGVAFSHLVENAVRQKVDEAIRLVMTQACSALADAPLGPEALDEADGVIRSTTDDILDSLFTGTIRADLESHGRTATEALLHQDMEAWQQAVEAALAATLHDALDIVQEHRGEIARAILKALAQATGEAAVGKMDNGVETAVSIPAKAVSVAVSHTEHESEGEKETVDKRSQPRKETVETRSEPRKKKVADQGENIRDQLAGIGNTLRDQVEQEAKGLKDRLSGGVKEGAKQGMRNQQLGRPPSARSSNRSTPGRPPSHGPVGRPPSVRRHS